MKASVEIFHITDTAPCWGNGRWLKEFRRPLAGLAVAGERCGEWRAYSRSFGVTYHSRLGFKFIAPVFKLHNAVIR